MSSSYDYRVSDWEEKDGITSYCANCGIPLRKCEGHSHRGEHFCSDCFDSLRVAVCDCCYSTILKTDDYIEKDGFVFCEDCMDKEYTVCETCGALVVEGDKCLVIADEDVPKVVCESCLKNKRDIFKPKGVG